jgi:hypothetical protein
MSSYKTAQVVDGLNLPTPRTLLPKGGNDRVYTPSVNTPDIINHNYKHKLTATALAPPSAGSLPRTRPAAGAGAGSDELKQSCAPHETAVPKVARGVPPTETSNAVIRKHSL